MAFSLNFDCLPWELIEVSVKGTLEEARTTGTPGPGTPTLAPRQLKQSKKNNC